MEGEMAIILRADVPTNTGGPDWEYNMRREMQEVLPGLYLGPFASALKSQRDQLLAKGITDIICVRHETERKFIKENMPETFRYLTVSICDSPAENIIPFFAQVSEYIDDVRKRGGRVLVHGNAGISRSATLVIAYVMEKQLLTANQALRLVQSKRFCVFPNEGFRRQLFEYEPILVARVAAAKRGLPIGTSHPKRAFSELEQDSQEMDTRNDTDNNGQ